MRERLGEGQLGTDALLIRENTLLNEDHQPPQLYKVLALRRVFASIDTRQQPQANPDAGKQRRENADSTANALLQSNRHRLACFQAKQPCPRVRLPNPSPTCLALISPTAPPKVQHSTFADALGHPFPPVPRTGWDLDTLGSPYR